jgi:hypothetical protein
MSVSTMAPRQARRVFLLASLVTVFGVACLKTRTPSIATRAPAPAFSLTDTTGKQVSLAEMTAHGPAVVVFYRGYW